MALNSYTALKASVADWLNKDNLTTQVPDFITMAAVQIGRRLVKDGPVLDMMAESAITVNAEYVNVPTRFMGAISIYLDGATVPLQFVLPEKLVEMKQIYATRGGNPTHFAVVGRRLRFWPWNGEEIEGELSFWQGVEPLSDSLASNWLLELHPDAYLYGALTQAAPYLNQDDRVETWAALFTNVLSDIVEADKVTRHAPHMQGPRPVIAA